MNLAVSSLQKWEQFRELKVGNQRAFVSEDYFGTAVGGLIVASVLADQYFRHRAQAALQGKQSKERSEILSHGN